MMLHIDYKPYLLPATFTHTSTLNKTFIFQAKGCSKETAGLLLQRVTDTGNVPETLRLAHLIGAAIKTGQSSNSA